MASLLVSAEELSCLMCRDIFKTPVLLSCSHSFCKECLHQFWRTKETQECPVCRRRSSKFEPPVNLALQNLCESLLKKRKESRSSGSEEICSLHSEKLKLFCVEDKQPVCVECVTSQQHINHTFRPISEAVSSQKDEDYTPLKSSQEKLKRKEGITGEFEETGQHIQNINDLKKKSNLIEDGNPLRYRLQTRTDDLDHSEQYRKRTFGSRDTNKPHKVILLVGETGTGKTTLINTMINYMLGVQREDKVWFEITDDQSEHRSSVHSQTSSITVYEFYLQESPIHLTIIDTPGYGDTRGVEKDKEIARNLLGLSSEDFIRELDAVCLVIKADQNRLSDRQIYIFDAIQSLFGEDVTKNIVLLLTHSRRVHPHNSLTAVEEANIQCAVNEQNQPVFFLFDNCQGETFLPEYQMAQKLSWDLSLSEITKFFKFTENIEPKKLKKTHNVLQKRKQLDVNISNLQSHIKNMGQKQNVLKRAQEDLEKNKKDAEENKNFEYEVDVVYKEKVDIDPAVASVAMCCTVCKENCHYPGCWWVTDVSWCSVMKDNHCTVCTNKCHYSKHIKSAKIYETKTKKEKKTNEESKKKYNNSIIKIKEGESLVKKLKEQLQKLEIEKVKLVMEAYHCVDALDLIALNTDSLFTLQHIDYLIEKLKEISEPGKAETLENIKKRAGEEKNRAVRYMKESYKK